MKTQKAFSTKQFLLIEFSQTILSLLITLNTTQKRIRETRVSQKKKQLAQRNVLLTQTVSISPRFLTSTSTSTNLDPIKNTLSKPIATLKWLVTVSSSLITLKYCLNSLTTSTTYPLSSLFSVTSVSLTISWQVLILQGQEQVSIICISISRIEIRYQQTNSMWRNQKSRRSMTSMGLQQATKTFSLSTFKRN